MCCVRVMLRVNHLCVLVTAILKYRAGKNMTWATYEHNIGEQIHHYYYLEYTNCWMLEQLS